MEKQETPNVYQNEQNGQIYEDYVNEACNAEIKPIQGMQKRISIIIESENEVDAEEQKENLSSGPCNLQFREDVKEDFEETKQVRNEHYDNQDGTISSLSSNHANVRTCRTSQLVDNNKKASFQIRQQTPPLFQFEQENKEGSKEINDKFDQSISLPNQTKDSGSSPSCQKNNYHYGQGGYHSDFSAQYLHTTKKCNAAVDTSQTSLDKLPRRSFGRPLASLGRGNQSYAKAARIPTNIGLNSSGNSTSFIALTTQQNQQQRANSNVGRHTPIDSSARGEQATRTTSSQLLAGGRNKMFPGSFSTWSSSEEDPNLSISSQNGSSSFSQFEFKSAIDATTNNTAPMALYDNEKLIKSPRLSPLQTFDTMIKDSSKKVNAEFPFTSRKSKKLKYGKSHLIDFPERIEEDGREEEEMPEYRRPSRYSEMRDHNEFGGNKHKRYRSEEKKKKKQHMQRLVIPAQLTNIANVWETDEEDIGSDSSLQNKKKVKVMSLGHLSQLLNKKIFSDDFDKSSDIKIKSKQWKGDLSAIEGPIDEDIESENENGNYLSDSSSNSQFSLQRRQLSFNLSALIDKLDPNDNDSQIASKYFCNINDTIEEEIDDNEEAPEHRTRLSSHSSSQRNNHSNRQTPSGARGLAESFKFMNLPRVKVNRATRSICSETINEELEEYLVPERDSKQQMDPRQHYFRVPSSRSRANSGEESSQSQSSQPELNQKSRRDSVRSLPTILEQPYELRKPNLVRPVDGHISEGSDNKSSSTDENAKVICNILSLQ